MVYYKLLVGKIKLILGAVMVSWWHNQTRIGSFNGLLLQLLVGKINLILGAVMVYYNCWMVKIKLLLGDNL